MGLRELRKSRTEAKRTQDIGLTFIKLNTTKNLYKFKIRK
jgi:hypothetical protein